MATGFVQRFKGKIAVAAIYVNGQPQFGSRAIQALSTTSATAIINNNGITTVNSSSAITVWKLQAPSAANINVSKTIQLTVSSGIFITSSTDGSVTFNGSTITALKSTQNTVLELVPTSSVNWAITGIFPGSTLTASVLTLSTTT